MLPQNNISSSKQETVFMSSRRISLSKKIVYEDSTLSIFFFYVETYIHTPILVVFFSYLHRALREMYVY